MKRILKGLELGMKAKGLKVDSIGTRYVVVVQKMSVHNDLHDVRVPLFPIFREM